MGRVSNTKEKLMESISELIWTGSYGTTTIDQICEKAGVQKGSFYHFFDSKADLAVSAIDSCWQEKRKEIDAIFSPIVPPLERLQRYCDHGYLKQVEMRKECGHVLGCPLFSLGSEISTQEDRVQKKIREILDYTRMYLESAIRDAHTAGLIHAPDAAEKAQMLFAYYQGLMTQARIENNLRVLKDAGPGTLKILGVSKSVSSAA